MTFSCCVIQNVSCINADLFFRKFGFNGYRYEHAESLL